MATNDNLIAAAAAGRRKRASQQQLAEAAGDNGAIYVTTTDGRYVKKIVAGQLQIPTAVVALPQLGKICFADAGLVAKIECADMDGNLRSVCLRIRDFISDGIVYTL